MKWHLDKQVSNYLHDCAADGWFDEPFVEKFKVLVGDVTTEEAPKRRASSTLVQCSHLLDTFVRLEHFLSEAAHILREAKHECDTSHPVDRTPDNIAAEFCKLFIDVDVEA